MFQKHTDRIKGVSDDEDPHQRSKSHGGGVGVLILNQSQFLHSSFYSIAASSATNY